MKSHGSRRSGRRRGGRRFSDRNDRSNRSSDRDRRSPQSRQTKPSLWQRILAFFRPKSKATTATNGSAPRQGRRGTDTEASRPQGTERPPRKQEEVTSPKLYVGNLSYEATESDLFSLFNGVGRVQNAEVVSYRDTERSKGFGFVWMTTIDEAKRAVAELHDRDFMGRKLVVSGARSNGPQG